MDTTRTEDTSRRAAPVSELIRSLFADVALLVRREAEMAQIELKDKTSKAGGAAAMAVAGGVMGIFGVATLIAACVLALAIVLPAWAAALIVAALLLVVAAALIVMGRNRMRAAAPFTPTRTLDAAKEDIAWMRLKTEQLKASE